MAKSNDKGGFEVAVDQFSGPLHLLLELIEKQELPITEVSLTKVTGPYLEYMEREDVPMNELADFLLVATRLLYLKSKEMIPDLEAEEEESAGKLASQLRLYKMFTEVAGHVDGLYSPTQKMHVRLKPTLPKPDKAGFPENITPDAMERSFKRLMKMLEPFLRLAEKSMERVRSVSERMNDLRTLIKKKATMAFGEITKTAKSKMDVVVSFLALLELAKQRVVTTSQKGTFDDITISRV